MRGKKCLFRLEKPVGMVYTEDKQTQKEELRDMNDCALAMERGELDAALGRLYPGREPHAVRGRVNKVLEGYRETFGRPAQSLFSAPGRTELGGNHTDHQRGHVLAAAVDLDLLAAVGVVEGGVIRVLSEGYPMIEVDLAQLEPQPGEENTSAALIRGVAAALAQRGCDFKGAGVEVYMVSDVPGGSGLSSSAAFEVLFGTIFNELFFGGKATAVEIAQMGQYAENVFFGKPCGLMDQTASSVGGAVAIDFADPARPVVERLELDLHAQGYALCILDSHASHADLTGEYAAITDELKAVSGFFGKEVLRDVPEPDFYAALPQLRELAGDRAVLRAMHFYSEDDRARWEAEALKAGLFQDFLTLVRESGGSSAMCLQNVTPTGAVREQALMVTIALAQRLLGELGAARVHGGGFGGTAQAFVPLDVLEEFKARMEAVLGKGSCHVVTIRPVGGVRLA